MLKFLTPLSMLLALAGCAGDMAAPPASQSADRPDPAFTGPEKPRPAKPIKEDPPLPKPPFFE